MLDYNSTRFAASTTFSPQRIRYRTLITRRLESDSAETAEHVRKRTLTSRVGGGNQTITPPPLWATEVAA